MQTGAGLVALTLAYNIAESLVALWSGAKSESIVLLGFGLDSIIECAASGVLLWRLGVEARGSEPEHIEVAERRVRRFIGGTFLALALYVVVQGGWTLFLRRGSWLRQPSSVLYCDYYGIRHETGRIESVER